MSNGIDIGKLSEKEFKGKDREERDWIVYRGIERTQQIVTESHRKFLPAYYKWIGLAVTIGLLVLIVVAYDDPAKASKAAGTILRKIP